MKSYGIIRRVSHLVNWSCLMTLYYSLIYPYLTYCNIVWAASYPWHLNQILLIHKSFLRMISNFTSQKPFAPLFRKFKLLSVFSVNTLQTCKFMYKFITHKQDLSDTFNNYFLLSSDIHSFQRGAYPLSFYRTCNHQFSIKFSGPQLCNSLDRSLKS